MKIIRVDHVGIVVRDLDRASNLLADVLRCKATEKVKTGSQKYWWQKFVVGDVAIEVAEPTGAGSPMEGQSAERRTGLHHMCLIVDDLDQAVKEITAAGYAIADDEIRVGGKGERYAFLDPLTTGGILLELKEEGS